MNGIPNPLRITLSPDSNYDITCVANAAFTQKVTVKDSSGNVMGVFQGVGEGVQLQLVEGGDSLGGATRGQIPISAFFEIDVGSGFTPSNVTVDTTASLPNGGTITAVATEDSVDNDNNDTVMTVVQTPLYRLSPPRRCMRLGDRTCER